MSSSFIPPNKENIKKRYDNNKELYCNLIEEVKLIIDRNIKNRKIKISHIESRLKKFNKFYEKIMRKKYIGDPFELIEDIGGVRIICVFMADLKKIKNIINENFETIKSDISSEKEDLKFGYLSDHYIVRLPDYFKGEIYDKIKHLKCEIQVRTISMHAQAEVSHDLDYKKKVGIPIKNKKGFAALTGLTYTFDSTVDKIKQDIEKSKKEQYPSLLNSVSIDDVHRKVRDGLSTYKKIDETDVKILEGLSLLGPRNLALVAEYLKKPTTFISNRIELMLSNFILFIHLNPYHTNMGLRKAVIFVEAFLGHADLLLDCLRVNDYWLYLSRIYGRYEGWGGIWTIPNDNVEDFKLFLKSLVDLGVAKNVEINWTTCHEGIPVTSRWFSIEENSWVFNWDEWINEVENIEGELPWTVKDPEDWPIRVDYTDLLIIKELEKDGRATMTDISKNIGIPLETVKYHFREHVLKRDLIEGYQIEIYRFPPLSSEMLFFKFEFDSHEKFKKFALSLLDKPFPIGIVKILGKNSLIITVNLPKVEFRRFINALDILIRKGMLESYSYWNQDMFMQWRETIPYQYFENVKWKYDIKGQMEELANIIEKNNFLKSNF